MELTKRGYKCVLFTNGLHADYEFAQEVLSSIHMEGFVDAICLEELETVQDLVNIINSFSSEIVTRLHASIIAYSYNVPESDLYGMKNKKCSGKQYIILRDLCHRIVLML